MSYFINDTPISQWGLQAGVIGSDLTGYALSGAWSLPKRIGETYHNWTGEVEPYVDADDIYLDGRDLTLSLVCKADSPAELYAKIEIFEETVPDNFLLTNDRLGSFEVSLRDIEVTRHSKTWASLKLNLREPKPAIGKSLSVAKNGANAVAKNGANGIDGFSWRQLGLALDKIDNRSDLPRFAELSITKSPFSEGFVEGYREPLEIAISGTIIGDNYDDFKTKVEHLQALISAAGLRKIRHFDGSVFDAFCVDGFEVSQVTNFKPIHWAKFNCKMITV